MILLIIIIIIEIIAIFVILLLFLLLLLLLLLSFDHSEGICLDDSAAIWLSLPATCIGNISSHGTCHFQMAHIDRCWQEFYYAEALTVHTASAECC